LEFQICHLKSLYPAYPVDPCKYFSSTVGQKADFEVSLIASPEWLFIQQHPRKRSFRFAIAESAIVRDISIRQIVNPESKIQ
jgi:hypothetical protein